MTARRGSEYGECPDCGIRHTEDCNAKSIERCDFCGELKKLVYDYGTKCTACGNTEYDDPTPWCHICNAMQQSECRCGPIADNE